LRNLFVSCIGNFLFLDSFCQIKLHDLIIPDFPESVGGIPLPARLPDPALQFDFSEADPQADKLIIRDATGTRFVLRFSDDDFHGLNADFALRVITIADADKLTSVLLKELLRAFLTG
jgi:hypothetical protein